MILHTLKMERPVFMIPYKSELQELKWLETRTVASSFVSSRPR